MPLTTSSRRGAFESEKPIRCEHCGAVIGTAEELAYAAKRSGQERDNLCRTCRQARMADTLAHTFGE